MDDIRIEFHAIDKDILPAPYPAVRGLPAWYKAMPGDADVSDLGGNLHTVKQCPPFLDAMGAGYILPLSGELRFATDDAGALTWESPHGDASIETHHPAQIAGSPWADQVVIKFINPWIIVTPPGYSTLFVAPLNQESGAFEILSGLVETDGLYAPVHFPAVCRMARGSAITLPRAMPLVQAIPFKRDAWHMQIGHADAKRLQEFSQDITHMPHIYRERIHEKKRYV
jgi:hypothetical protein